MTGPDSQDTRPISVAELLARNGTIGAPPVGGRRRRRRGNSDAVTVAELTGEIPIIRPDEEPAAEAPETMKTAEETAEARDAPADTEVPAEEMVPDAVDNIDSGVAGTDLHDEDIGFAFAEEHVDEHIDEHVDERLAEVAGTRRGLADDVALRESLHADGERAPG